MKKRKGIEMGLIAFAVTATAFVLLWTAGNVIVENEVIDEVERIWQDFPTVGFADPGTGASGVLRAGIVKDGSTFTSNLTDADYWEYTETNNTDAGSNVPYDTNFYICYFVRWNKTHAFNETSDTYEHDWVEGYLNCSDLSISSQAMTEANITGCETTYYIFMHYYAGPYTISRGQSISDVVGNWRAYYS